MRPLARWALGLMVAEAMTTGATVATVSGGLVVLLPVASVGTCSTPDTFTYVFDLNPGNRQDFYGPGLNVNFVSVDSQGVLHLGRPEHDDANPYPLFVSDNQIFGRRQLGPQDFRAHRVPPELCARPLPKAFLRARLDHNKALHLQALVLPQTGEEWPLVDSQPEASPGHWPLWDPDGWNFQTPD